MRILGWIMCNILRLHSYGYPYIRMHAWGTKKTFTCNRCGHQKADYSALDLGDYD